MKIPEKTVCDYCKREICTDLGYYEVVPKNIPVGYEGYETKTFQFHDECWELKVFEKKELEK